MKKVVKNSGPVNFSRIWVLRADKSARDIQELVKQLEASILTGHPGANIVYTDRWVLLGKSNFNMGLRHFRRFQGRFIQIRGVAGTSDITAVMQTIKSWDKSVTC
ncbi:MAG: hypothetical protein WC955_05075 [Elusimicrobiota bacterium]